MKQYWMFTINSIINMIFCAVDVAFGNNISIDAVVVMGSFSILSVLGSQLLFLGVHAYKVLQAHEKNCCLLSLLAGVILGILCIPCSYPITFIFELTDIQRDMLSQVLICYGICCPIESVGQFMMAYITLKCYNKLMIWSNVGTYILLVGTDWLAVHLGFGCNGLVMTTGLSWFAYAVICIAATKFFGIVDKLNLAVLKQAFVYGKDITLGRIISRAANLVFGHFASTMGTEQYAIHSVALNAVGLAEHFRDAQVDYTLIKLKDRDKTKERMAKRVFKQCWLPALLLPLAASFILVCGMHGKVALTDAIFGVMIYDAQMLLFPIYDTVQQFVISRSKTKYITITCVICMLWRIPIVYLCSETVGISLWTLGGIYFLDYLSRMMFYILRLRRDKKTRLKQNHLVDNKI